MYPTFLSLYLIYSEEKLYFSIIYYVSLLISQET